MQVSGQGIGKAALWCAMMALVLGSAVAAADEAALPATQTDAVPVETPERGPVTNLPLPRFVSLKGSEGNARRGPSLSHRIDWIFQHNGMPLKITAEYGNWRRVEDSEGAGGWVHYSLLSGVRSVTVTVESLDLRVRADPGAPVVAQAEQGAIARLGECFTDWCRISVPGVQGWAPKSALWGVSADELRD